LDTYGTGGLGVKFTETISRMSFSGSAQYSRGFSPATGKVSSKLLMGDCPKSGREAAQTWRGAEERRRAEMSFMAAKL
jgi:hypothetical protein